MELPGFAMRLPWGLLLIVGLIVFMYLFGLLIAYKRREFSKFPSPEPETRSFDDQPAVDIEVMAYLEKGERDLLRYSSRTSILRMPFWSY